MSKATDAPRLMVWKNPATGDRYTILPDGVGSWDIYRRWLSSYSWNLVVDEDAIDAVTYAEACEAFGNIAAERGWTLE